MILWRKFKIYAFCMICHITFPFFPFHFIFPSYQSEGQMLKETTYINKSLLFLEQAILALGDRRRDHVPFRQTKLTHALKDTLGKTARPLALNNTGAPALIGSPSGPLLCSETLCV